MKLFFSLSFSPFDLRFNAGVVMYCICKHIFRVFTVEGNVLAVQTG